MGSVKIFTCFRLEKIKKLNRYERKMITSKIKKRDLLLLILIVIGLILSLISVALYMGEQYPEIETFRLVFYFSIFGSIVFAILLAIAIMYLPKWRKKLFKM